MKRKAIYATILASLGLVLIGARAMSRIPVPADPKIILSELLPHELAQRVKQRPVAVIPI